MSATQNDADFIGRVTTIVFSKLTGASVEWRQEKLGLIVRIALGSTSCSHMIDLPMIDNAKFDFAASVAEELIGKFVGNYRPQKLDS